jgi:hypothetical protein
VTLGWAKGKGFDGLMAATGSLAEPKVRAGVLGDAATAIQTMGQIPSMTEDDIAPLANAALRALDGRSLTAMRPDRAASLAGIAPKGQPGDLAATANHLSSLPPSLARDATGRTLFLKTDCAAYENQPGLPRAMGSALALSETSDPAKAASLSTTYSQMLGSKEGRAFLADPNVDPSSRMWAASQVAADPAGAAKMIASQDKPWETSAVAQAFARPTVDRMAAARGNEATLLKGGTDIDNFVGASIGAQITATPETEAEAAQGPSRGRSGSFQLLQRHARSAEGR